MLQAYFRRNVIQKYVWNTVISLFWKQCIARELLWEQCVASLFGEQCYKLIWGAVCKNLVLGAVCYKLISVAVHHKLDMEKYATDLFWEQCTAILL